VAIEIDQTYGLVTFTPRAILPLVLSDHEISPDHESVSSKHVSD
jgi:hypothetical protein